MNRKSVIAGILCVLICVFTPIFAFSKLKKTANPVEKSEEYKGILSLWQLDTFEGGRGSRQDYLNEIALDFCKKEKNILINVQYYTFEGAKEKIQRGIYPDMISFGTCGLNLSEAIVNLPLKNNYPCEAENKCYAKIWCRGVYYVLTRTSTDISNCENVYISKTDFNNPYLAMAENGISFLNCKELLPVDAYAEFLRNKNSVLIGTQRDIFRLSNKGIDFKALPLKEYSDINQFICVTAEKSEKIFYSRKFIEYLLNEKSQKKLIEIGMFSPSDLKLYTEDENLKAGENVEINYISKAFLSSGEINALIKASKKCMEENGKGLAEIKNLLK